MLLSSRPSERLKSALSIDFHFKIESARASNQPKRLENWATSNLHYDPKSFSKGNTLFYLLLPLQQEEKHDKVHTKDLFRSTKINVHN